MRLIGCDLYASQQSIAMLDRDTGVVVETTLTHEGGAVREFYASIPPPVVVGIEATGSMGWFLRLMEELALACRVGHPTAIRKAETRRQKHDRRDAALLLQLLAEDRFPAIWMPSTEYRDLRSLLLHRHQWVRMRTRVQNALHAIVLAHGVRRGHTLWNRDGQALLASLRLPPHTADRRSDSKRCINTCRRPSIDSTTESGTWRMSVLKRRCSRARGEPVEHRNRYVCRHCGTVLMIVARRVT
jgi:Transposase